MKVKTDDPHALLSIKAFDWEMFTKDILIGETYVSLQDLRMYGICR
jgi:hypothetical protein